MKYLFVFSIVFAMLDLSTVHASKLWSVFGEVSSRLPKRGFQGQRFYSTMSNPKFTTDLDSSASKKSLPEQTYPANLPTDVEFLDIKHELFRSLETVNETNKYNLPDIEKKDDHTLVVTLQKKTP